MKRTRPIEPLTRDECAALLAATGSGPIGNRDRCCVALLWIGQLRVAEALSLEERDWEPPRLNVRRGKGRKQRIVVLAAEGAKWLDGWLALKRERGLNGPILCSLKGGQLYRQNVNRMLKRLARRAGILKRVHPHGMRHSGARHLADAGAPVPVISRQLGHASISTTHHYLELLDPRAQVAALAGLEWR